jgi:NAD(P)H dehydrogenase (quinone)
MNAPSSHRRLAPVRHLVVLGHPEPDSFCGSVARAYCDAVRACGQQASLRDLYALGFDPVLKPGERPGGANPAPSADIAEDLALLRRADVIALVYPIWFGMPPAIIKGYVDRVLGAGFAPEQLDQEPGSPLLRGKRLVLLTASASTRPWLEEKGQWLALRQAFETYLQGIFSLREGGHIHFDAITPGLAPRFVDECLEDARQRACAICAEAQRERRASQSLAIRKGQLA